MARPSTFLRGLRVAAIVALLLFTNLGEFMLDFGDALYFGHKEIGNRLWFWHPCVWVIFSGFEATLMYKVVWWRQQQIFDCVVGHVLSSIDMAFWCLTVVLPDCLHPKEPVGMRIERSLVRQGWQTSFDHDLFLLSSLL